ncbi:MAG: cytidylate kinase-like family protein [Candidatus Kapabacteria bacterium]|jgi:cytidylate kinase|nr:cytidylate kinase-like family protein [Candidatus Kapabacteria bacterium]
MARLDFWAKYLSEKHKYMDGQLKEAGPLITISRDHGCFGFHVTKHIISKIREITVDNVKNKEWTYLNKEIMTEAAEDLQTHPEQIDKMFADSDKHSIGKFFDAMVKHTYATDKQVLETVKQVINAQAWEGNVIIVGRSAASITQRIEKSLHVKLVAPLEFRIRQVEKLKGITYKEASTEVKEADKRRTQYLKKFSDHKTDIDLYDMTINTSRFSETAIADMIVRIAQDKGLF